MQRRTGSLIRLFQQNRCACQFLGQVLRRACSDFCSAGDL